MSTMGIAYKINTNGINYFYEFEIFEAGIIKI